MSFFEIDAFDSRPLQARYAFHSRPGAAQRTAILVLGMSRSGTSLCSRILNILGAYLPQALLGPSPANPLGHWEPRELVAVNEQILRALGRSWDDPRDMPGGWLQSRTARDAVGRIADRIAQDYAGASLLLIKDPRICRLAPLYFAALIRLEIRPAVVLCTRHPGEIASSLQARDGIGNAAAELLWLRHLIEAEAASRDYARVWTSFDGLLGDWQQEAGAIGRVLGIAWPNQPQWIWAEMETAVQPALRTWTTDEAAGQGSDALLARRSWKAVRYALAGDEIAARALFDEAAAMLAELDRLGRTYGERHDQALRAIRSSTSWRVTAPLRFVRMLTSCRAAAG